MKRTDKRIFAATIAMCIAEIAAMQTLWKFTSMGIGGVLYLSAMAAVAAFCGMLFLTRGRQKRNVQWVTCRNGISVMVMNKGGKRGKAA